MSSLLIWILVFPRILYHFIFFIGIVIFGIWYKLRRRIRPASPNFILNRNRLAMFKSRFQSRSTSVSPISLVLLLIIRLDVISCKEYDDSSTSIDTLAEGLVEMMSSGRSIESISPSGGTSRTLMQMFSQGPRKLNIDLIPKLQNLLLKIKKRVDATDVETLVRKPIDKFGEDLFKIAGALIEEARKNPNAISGDFQRIQVDGFTIEDALYNVGLQMKAYYIDLTNYRNIVKWFLNLPTIPSLLATIPGGPDQNQNLESLRSLTQQIGQNSIRPLKELTNIASDALQLARPSSYVVDPSSVERITSQITEPLANLSLF